MPTTVHRLKAAAGGRKARGLAASPDAIHRLRTDKLAASRTTFARLLKVSENTVFRWEAGKVKPDPHAAATMEHLNRICDVLLPSMAPAAIAQWFERPNPGIENFRPVDLIEFEYGRQKLKALIEETGLVVQAL
jgi:DNA-binding transcriptional regulator YiaG